MTLRRANARTRTLSVLVVTGALLAACGSSDSESDSAGSGSSGTTGVSDTSETGSQAAGLGEVVVALSTQPTSWDGLGGISVLDGQVVAAVSEPLLRMDPVTAEPVAGLASSFEYSDDLTQLVITLNPDAAFSTGQSVTVDDVLFSAQRWLAESPGNINRYMIDHVSEVEAGPGEGQVTFISESPNSFIPAALAGQWFGVYPKDFGGITEDEFFQRPIGAGPFMIESERTGDEIVLVPNEHYWNSNEPGVERLTMAVIPDVNQRLLQFESGSVDVVLDVPIDLGSQLPADTLQTFPSTFIDQLAPNWASPPLDDADFRRALSLAIDRSRLVEGLSAGLSEVATGVIASTLAEPTRPSTGDWSVYDPEASRSLIEASGYDGRPLSLIVNSSRGLNVIMAEAIAEMLEEVGIAVNVERLETQIFTDRYFGETYTGGDYDLAVGPVQAYLPHPAEFIRLLSDFAFLFVNGPTDTARMTYDAVLAASANDQPAVLTELEDWAYDNTARIPISTSPVAAAVADQVSGFRYNRLGYFDTGALTITSD
jgi:peptide/nickel transport system substrate-binding protein